MSKENGSTEMEPQDLRDSHPPVERQRELMAAVIGALSDPVLVLDAERRPVLLNRCAEDLFTARESDSEGRGRVLEVNTLLFGNRLERAAGADSEAETPGLILLDPTTGEELLFEVVRSPLPLFHAGQPMTMVVLREITEEKRMRGLRSQFLASMSHELRTPINALLGYTSLMRDRIYGELSERQEEVLGRMSAASEQLLKLVNDLLDLAKLEAGRMPVQVEPVDVRVLVRELVELLEPQLRDKQLVCRVELPDELPLLETDRAKVRQCLLNLLSNAIKFTPKGAIEILARRAESGDGVRVTVKDTGIGIRADHLSRIFEDFRQADQSSTREYEGTGLGLSITRKVLQLLGGSIGVDSAPGEGSSFTVWLPRRSEEHAGDGEAIYVPPEIRQVLEAHAAHVAVAPAGGVDSAEPGI